MDRNGYNPSVLPTSEEECYACGIGGDLVRHEIYFGANRSVSKAEGTWCYLCPRCHRRVHEEPISGLNDFLKKEGQYYWEHANGKNREEFAKIFGRRYI